MTPEQATDTAAAPLLAARGISVRFGGVQALEAVSITADRGVITGLIGPNGAGKTTLFNVLGGLVRPDEGRVHLDGTDITAWPAYRRGRAGITRTFQRLELFTRLSVLENLTAAWEASHRGGALGRARRDRIRCVDEVVELLGLGAIAHRSAGTLPTGLGRQVELGRALCTEPCVLLLDEPSSGLDAKETARFARVMRTIVGGEYSPPALVLVEHDMSLVMDVCGVITVLDFGKTIARGSPDEVRSDPAVRTAYLGESHAA